MTNKIIQIIQIIKTNSSKLMIFAISLFVVSFIVTIILKDTRSYEFIHFLCFALFFLGGVGNGMNFLEGYKKSVIYIGFIKYLIIFSNIIFFISSLIFFIMSLIYLIKFIRL